MTESQNIPPVEKDPDYGRVRNYLLYGLSLPERTLRSATGMVGGVLRESASLLVPQAFQDSKTYNLMVRQMLDFLAEDLGGVQRDAPADDASKVEHYVARKTVANFIDLAGMATLHLSPMLVLAVVSDVAYGSGACLKELAAGLKQEGVISQDSTIDHVDDLLAAVAKTAGVTATALAVPPLSVEGLRQTIDQTRQAAGGIDPTALIPQAEIERLWREIHDVAATQGVNPLTVSSAMTLYSLDKIGRVGRGALSSVRAAGTLVDRHILAHYRTALGDISTKGIYRSISETSRPYIDAVWRNYSSGTSTITEQLFSGKLIAGAWRTVRGWFGRRSG